MMRSATAFLPDSMITFMNLDRSTEPNFGSGRMSRLGTSRRRGISRSPFSSVDAGPKPAPRRSPGPCGRPYLPLTRRPAHKRATVRSCPVQRDRAADPFGDGSGLLGPLGAVLRARLLAILDALQIERTAHDVVAHARQILD